MAEKPIDLGLTALDELFMTDAQRQENKLPRIRDIPLDQIDDMPLGIGHKQLIERRQTEIDRFLCQCLLPPL